MVRSAQKADSESLWTLDRFTFTSKSGFGLHAHCRVRRCGDPALGRLPKADRYRRQGPPPGLLSCPCLPRLFAYRSPAHRFDFGLTRRSSSCHNFQCDSHFSGTSRFIFDSHGCWWQLLARCTLELDGAICAVKSFLTWLLAADDGSADDEESET